MTGPTAEKKGSRARLWWGCILVAASLLANEVTIQAWWHDGVFWSVGNRVATALLQALLLTAGLTLLVLWRRKRTVRDALAGMLRTHPRTAGLLAGVLLLLGAGLGLALAARAAIVPADRVLIHNATTGEPLERFAQEDVLLGYRPLANQAVTVHKTAGAATVYRVTYRFDGRHRRDTPAAAGEGTEHFAIFMGCSLVFGEGVEQRETLPYHFGVHSPRHRPYNYGFSGYGTQQMLALLEEGGLRSEIEEPRGVLVYLYSGFHVPRVIGSLRVFNGWGAHMPYYFVDEAGVLRRSGTFTSGRPWTSLWFWAAGKLRLGRLLNLDYPKRRPEHYELVARIVEASRDRFRELFPGSHFLVVYYPLGSRDEQVPARLEQRGIRVLDYGDLLDASDPSLRIPGDGHPTAKAYETIARRLAAEVGRTSLPAIPGG